MQKVLAAIVASVFALGTTVAFAKQEDLSKDQRADMRARADQLTRSRATGTEHKQAEATPVTAKKHTTKKTTKHTTTKKSTKQTTQ
jgi:hypothetical protein